jgi:hypothetical protein
MALHTIQDAELEIHHFIEMLFSTKIVESDTSILDYNDPVD